MSHLPSSLYIRDPSKAAAAYARARLEKLKNQREEAKRQGRAKRRRFLKTKARRKLARASRREQRG